MSRFRVVSRIALGVLLVASAGVAAPRAFPSAEEAANALVEACRTQDAAALRALVDEDKADEVFELRDPGTRDRLAIFAEAADRRLVLREAGTDRFVMDVGFQSYPFPVPIERGEDGWYFDAEEGREEILDRTIGWNELIAISVLRGYVDAQVDYASEPHDETPVRKFATKFLSTPGKRDGLYWEADEAGGEEPSPFGPLVDSTRTGPEPGAPYYGYHYRILTAQGENAPGGAYSYVINGNLVAGFAAVAWPARYDKSGVMTFLVNHYGDVKQKDLGPDSAKIAAALDAYDPGEGWEEAE